MVSTSSTRLLTLLIVALTVALAISACVTESPELASAPAETTSDFQTSNPTVVPAAAVIRTPDPTQKSSPRSGNPDKASTHVPTTAQPPAISTATPADQAIPTETVSFQPPVIEATSSVAPTTTPTAQSNAPASTPPPYHYKTIEEANTGSEQLGCSGWSGVTVDGVSYIRSCGSHSDFELLSSGSGVTLSGEPCTIESDPTARFTHTPTELAQIASIVPAGSPSGGVIKPHSYLHNKNKADGKNIRVPVYAVADAVLTSISYYNTTVDSAEYLIFFDVTCEISFKYDHLSELAPKLASVAPETPADDSRGSKMPPIELEAGELIGYSIGAGGQGAWDFGAYDLTHTNQFANQERYRTASQSLHTVCPYEYFVEPLQSDLFALFGTHDQRLLPNIICTTTERDVLGSAAGAWFDSPELDFSGSKVAIAIIPGDAVAITGINGDVRIDKGQPTWLEPSLVTFSHCYSGSGRWFFIEISSDGMQMSIADGRGGCPVSMPSGATTYFR